MNKKFYITTPIYYVNASPHVGHTYTTVAADVIARYHQMIGDEVFFLTGTDEHGAKIEAKAEAGGKKPQEFADEVAAKFKFAWDELNISHSRFIRTTEKEHIKAVQKALQFMYEKQDIYLGKYEGLYCQGCEQFKSEKDLVNGKCPEHDTVPEKVSEESYMFKTSKYQKELIKKIENDEFKIRPEEKKNEILSFYKRESLKDVSFSRKNVNWGIPLPWDKSHTAYVWADAFLNYLTGLGWEGDIKGGSASNLEAEPPYKKFWPPDIQLMSKDILRVHTTIWPAMLLSLGLPLPKEIFVHGYFLIEGKKMSKSVGNVIAPEEMIKKYGVDGTRYLLMSATPFGHDGDISWEKFDEKYNADLANGIGNLAARTLTMTEKYFDGKVPNNIDYEDVAVGKSPVIVASNKTTLRTIIDVGVNNYIDSIKKDFDLYFSLLLVMKRINSIDIYISEYKPFKLIKEDKEKTAAVLYNCLESIRIIAWMLWPFMPETAEKIWTSLGLETSKELAKDFKEATVWGGLEPGTKVKKGNVLFPRI